MVCIHHGDCNLVFILQHEKTRRHAMYVKRNIEARAWKHWRNLMCVFVASGIQHAMHMRRIAIFFKSY